MPKHLPNFCLYFLNFQVQSVNYSVTCLSDDAPTLSGTSTTTFLLFTKVDGVRAGTDYTCHVTMTVSAYNGTNLGGGPLGSLWKRTTPKSQTASITTLEGKGWCEPSCFWLLTYVIIRYALLQDYFILRKCYINFPDMVFFYQLQS